MSEIPDKADKSARPLIIAANRTCVNIKALGNGDYEYGSASGGLVTALNALKDSTKLLWYGNPGKTVPSADLEKVEEEIRGKGAVPIWIDAHLMDLYYNKFSNGVLWPILHYHTDAMNVDDRAWDAYQKVNRQFAQKIAEDVEDGDLIWIHDYHLMLVPQMLREEIGDKKNVKIGFFLHTPFPSSYMFIRLPYAKAILEGLLQCDLVGFHTYDYVGHFLSSCAKILHLTTTPNGVQFVKNGVKKAVHVGAFPIGIDPKSLLEGMQSKEVIEQIQEYRSSYYKNKKVIISVDRLDYIKGLPHKLHAFDMFLQQYPEEVGKVVLVQVAVPSREDVPEYNELKAQLNQLCGLINSKYASPGYTPVEFMYRSVDKTTLLALYGMSDVCLVTSIRDGMNLVSYEYIACHEQTHGQLVISEFAGAAHSLKGCIVINPWDAGNCIEGIKKALELSPEQKEKNWKKMWKYVSKYTSAYWGQTFAEELARIGPGYSLPRNAELEPNVNAINGHSPPRDQDDSEESAMGAM